MEISTHILPCNVEKDGDIDSNRFYDSTKTESLTTSFRGRKLEGVSMKQARPELSCIFVPDQINSGVALNLSGSMLEGDTVLWREDTKPDENDPFLEALSKIKLLEAAAFLPHLKS
eukprot:maker-scaffold_5-snap-gene-3.42-mRNA-1 protein AED:0.00 eAED:0.00 QI:113/1/1/1/1/1/4/189/115